MKMILLAAFRYTENTILAVIAVLLIIPVLLAIWGWLKFPHVRSYSALVLSVFFVLLGLPLMVILEAKSVGA